MENKCQYCGEATDNPIMYLNMSLLIPEYEVKIDKLGRKDWWKKMEDPNLTEEEMKELDDLSFYDQLVNTMGKGYACTSCLVKDDSNYIKYYG